MRLSYDEKVSHSTHEISHYIQDTPVWDKYSVKYTQLNIQFGRAHNIQLSPEVEVVLVFTKSVG